MTRHRVSIVLVVVLVAFAGCNGFGQSGEDPTETAANSTQTEVPTNGTDATATPASTNGGNGTDSTATADEPTATQTPTGDATPTSTATQTATEDATQTPTDESGDTNTSLDQQLLDEHALALLSADNYTAFVSTSTGESSTTTVASVDLTAQSRYDQITTTTTSSTFNIEEYRPPGSDRMYQQVGEGDGASYFNESATDNFTASEIEEPYLITDVNYQQFGTSTVDGRTVQRYVANDVSSLNVTSDGWGGPIVTNISSVVLVDADQNIIYEIDADYAVQTSDGDIVNSTYTVTYSDIGSTTVSEPDWLSEAT